MIEPQTIEPPFQGTRGTHGNSNSKDWGLKAPMGTYRHHQLSIGLGLPNKIPRLINMNSWLKLREKKCCETRVDIFLFKITQLDQTGTGVRNTRWEVV